MRLVNLGRATAVVIGALAGLTSITGCAPTYASAHADGVAPLEAYLRVVWGTDLSADEQQRRYDAEQRVFEEQVSQCMADEGFDYVPNVDSRAVIVDAQTEWNLDDRDWVEQYGYGIANFPDSALPPAELFDSTDPNEAYVESLSASELDAYYAALFGPSLGQRDAGGSEPGEYDWTSAGCRGKAGHESNEDPLAADEFSHLSDAIQVFYRDMQIDPRFARIDADWAACMAEAGESGLRAQSDAQRLIGEELSAYYAGTSNESGDQVQLEILKEDEIALALLD